MTMTTPTTETGIVELLPCPFCGGPAAAQQYRSRNWGVGCVSHECQCTLTAEAYGTSRKRAIAAWNARAAIAAMPDSTQLLQTMAGALEAFAKVTAAYDYWCAEVMPDFTYPVDGTRLESAIQDCPAAIGQLTRSDFERAKAARAQFRAQEQRS